MIIKNYIGYITICVIGIIIGIILIGVLPMCEYGISRVMLTIFSLICSLSSIGGLIWVGCSVHDDKQAKQKIRIKIIEHNNCFLLIDPITWKCVGQFDNSLDAQKYANKLNQLR